MEVVRIEQVLLQSASNVNSNVGLNDQITPSDGQGRASFYEDEEEDEEDW